MKRLALSMIFVFVLLPPSAWAAFPQVAASNTSSVGSNETSHTVNLPTGIAAGNLLVCFVSVDGNPTVTWPAGWTEIFTPTSPGGQKLEGRYRFADGGEGSTLALTTSVVERSAHQCYRITDMHPSAAPESGTPCDHVCSGATTTPNPPSLTPSWGAADTLWFVVLAFSGGSVTYPTNYGNEVLSESDPGPGTGTAASAVARRELNASSENPGTMTIGDQAHVVTTIAIRPEASRRRASPIIFQ